MSKILVIEKGLLMKGVIFDIQRFSIHDGPGIRTTVFLKGCKLQCSWCHNPESIEAYPEIQMVTFRCIGCGKCVDVCPFNARKKINGKIVYSRELCQRCGKCTDVCYAGATVWVGKIMTVKSIIDEVERDHVFYNRSGGGVTFSGGEPMLQKNFLKKLLEECKMRDIHTAVDTSGFIPWQSFKEMIDLVDLYLYDIKLIDEEKHRKFTGVSNNIILKNLYNLVNNHANIIIRIPVVRGVNDSIEEMEKIAMFIKNLNGVECTELLNFHQLGSGKYKSLGKEYLAEDIKPLSREEMKKLGELFSKQTLNVKLT
jgi:pyruvate formate lyase activating enzyme